MTRKDLVKFHRLFNELVQKEVIGKPAYSFKWHPVDYCGGVEVVLRSDCIVWDKEICSLAAICRSMALSMYIELNDSRIIIH